MAYKTWKVTQTSFKIKSVFNWLDHSNAMQPNTWKFTKYLEQTSTAVRVNRISNAATGVIWGILWYYFVDN